MPHFDSHSAKASRSCCRRAQSLRSCIGLYTMQSSANKRIFVVLSGDVFALFHRYFYCDSFTKEENSIPNFPCTQRPLGNYWESALFSGPDFIANLSDWLKIKQPNFHDM